MRRHYAWILLAALATASCSDDDDDDNRTSFNQFVKDQLAATADDTEPRSVNGIEFAFDNADPAAFDDVLPPP